jgi:predicted metal-dependent TIM-barrel fold hydrolase
MRRVKADMSEKMLHNGCSSFLQRAQLMKLKVKAIRSGVWFRSLSRIDRVLFDLTMKVAVTVRSFILAKNILTVVRKLENSMASKFLCAVQEIGFPLARKLSLIAQKWGNVTAKEWEYDKGYAKYLAAMSFNKPKMFSV